MQPNTANLPNSAWRLEKSDSSEYQWPSSSPDYCGSVGAGAVPTGDKLLGKEPAKKLVSNDDKKVQNIPIIIFNLTQIF